jgi:hypothetical protein
MPPHVQHTVDPTLGLATRGFGLLLYEYLIFDLDKQLGTVTWTS